MTIYAKVSSLTNGYPHDIAKLNELNLNIGDVVEVSRIEMGHSSTSIYLKDHKGSFNSVNFQFLEDEKPLDIFEDPRFNPYKRLWNQVDGEKALKGVIQNARYNPVYKWVEGNVYNHPWFDDGSFIHTSSVLKIEGNMVETSNSFYTILNWREDPPKI